jgi:hypothetical protein
MRTSIRAIAHGLLASLIAIAPAGAQAPAPAPAGAAQSPAATALFKKEELEQLVAPIALYPDSLVAQILMASTYPLEVVEAARWSKANPGLKDKALEDALQKQTWDPSVKSLTAFPQVLQSMNEKLDMTQKLGDAFLAQQKDVLDAVQRLRGKADQAGNLKSSKEQNVTKAQEGGTTVIKIEPTNPETVYVPTYGPAVYGPWPYPAYPPYYYPYPGYVPGAAFVTFAFGAAVGAALWGGCNWGRGDININTNRYNNFNKTNINNGNWSHSPEHRKGAGYRDSASQQKFGGQRAGVDSREQFRGRAEQGRQELGQGGFDRGGGPSAGTADRGGGDRGGGDRGGGDRGGGSRGGSAGVSTADRGGGSFQGMDRGGGAARADSARGASSRQSMSGGGARAGGGGGGSARAGGGGGRAGGGGGGRR